MIGGAARVAWLAYLAAFFGFVFAPILVVCAVAFQTAGFVSFPIQGVSLQWFAKAFAYKPFMDGLLTSFEVAALSSGLAILVGTPAALALARRESRASDAVVTLILSPLSVPLIVLGYALLFYLSRVGLGTSFAGLVAAHTVVGLPYIVRTVVAVQRTVGRDLEEAALVLGATRFQVLRQVTLPLIRPGLVGGGLLAFLISLDNLPVSYFFSSPSTVTLPVVMLSYMESSFDPSIAALSVIQIAVAIATLLLINRFWNPHSMIRSI
jgi:putative spermidine/putrescine transport system permease protein